MASPSGRAKRASARTAIDTRRAPPACSAALEMLRMDVGLAQPNVSGTYRVAPRCRPRNITRGLVAVFGGLVAVYGGLVAVFGGLVAVFGDLVVNLGFFRLFNSNQTATRALHGEQPVTFTTLRLSPTSPRATHSSSGTPRGPASARAPTPPPPYSYCTSASASASLRLRGSASTPPPPQALALCAATLPPPRHR